MNRPIQNPKAKDLKDMKPLGKARGQGIPVMPIKSPWLRRVLRRLAKKREND